MGPEYSNRQQHQPPDVILNTLANERRRKIVSVLMDDDSSSWEYEPLVDLILENLASLEAEIGASSRERLSIELMHHHLPALEAADMVFHADDENRVDLTLGEFERDLIRVIERYNDPDRFE